MSNFKIRIFQPIVPEYRVALFEGLGRKYSGRIDICASESIRREKSCPISTMPFDYNHAFKRLGPIQWQCGFSLKGLSRGDMSL